MSRLEELRAMLKARTDMKGRPMPGYASNVDLVKAEIERLERSGDEKGLHGDGI